MRLVFLLLLMSGHLPKMTRRVSKTIKLGNPMESHRNFSNWLVKNQEEFWYSSHTGITISCRVFPAVLTLLAGFARELHCWAAKESDINQRLDLRNVDVICTV